MTINFDRLDAAISFAVANPDEFGMDSWFERQTDGRLVCGTTACLAGTVAVQAGWRPVWIDGAQNTDYVTDGKNEGFVPDVAESLLGFDPEDSDRFFYASSVDDVIRLRNEYAAEAGVPGRTWS